MLHIQGISKQYGSKILFENADAHIGHRSRIALIGANGAGKSTLIRILLGQEMPDCGHVSRARHLAIGTLAQELPKFHGGSVLSEVLKMDGRREELLEAKKELEELFSKETTQAMGDSEHLEDLERYGRVLEELESMDEYRLEPRAKEILLGMGFKSTDFDRNLTELSGGWLMRVALSRILLMEPDLLLLDEPTNHLDLESLLWLEDFLKAYRGAMLLVSHDSLFLNRMVHEVLEIDQCKLWIYRGNLDSYAEQKRQRIELLRAQYEGQQAKIAEIEKFVERFGAKATKAKQAQSRLKQLEKMDLIELPESRSTIRFRFPPAPHSGKEIITMKNAGVRFDQKLIFKNLNWVIQKGSRIAIVGVNGAGKTTLLRLLSGNLSPTQGTVKFGHEVKMGYYAQIQAESLDLNKSILQELEAIAPEMPMSQVRAIAGAFLFTGDAVEKKCKVLSGGEKARVALAKLLLSPSNFLILDEPTNHLDVESRGVLLEALQNYTGTLCLVSHDRTFVSSLVNSVLEILPAKQEQEGSQAVQFLGTYEDYLERKLQEVAERKRKSSTDLLQTPVSTEGTHETKSYPSNNQKRSWERERDRLEKEISTLEARHSELLAILTESQTYQDKTKSLALLEEQRNLEKNLKNKMERWEELCHKL